MKDYFALLMLLTVVEGEMPPLEYVIGFFQIIVLLALNIIINHSPGIEVLEV